MAESLRDRFEKIMEEDPTRSRVIAMRMAAQQLRYESEQHNRKNPKLKGNSK